MRPNIRPVGNTVGGGRKKSDGKRSLYMYINYSCTFVHCRQCVHVIIDAKLASLYFTQRKGTRRSEESRRIWFFRWRGTHTVHVYTCTREEGVQKSTGFHSLRRYDMNGRSQMQGGKNWILPKEISYLCTDDLYRPKHNVFDACRSIPRASGRGLGPESVAKLPPFGPIEGQKWFDQIFCQWESQKNRFEFISFGKIQFLPTCIWNLPFMSYRLWKTRIFWALWNGIEPIGECHLGPKKSRFPGHNISQMPK